jgi:SNF2 family DNA or RNA helicase
MLQVSQFRWVPRHDATTVVANYLQPSVCFQLDDVVELPEVVEEEVQVPQGLKQMKHYDNLKREAATMFDDGMVTAQNGGILFGKLLQVSCGYLYKGANQPYEVLDNGLRLEMMKSIIEGSDRKVIVFASFIHAATEISKYLTSEGIAHFTVTGSTPHHERTDIFHKFQSGTGREPLIAHPQCMAHGITLTAADTICWFGPIPSLEIFEQACARITRIGQRHRQQIYMLAGTPAERKIYGRLRSKRAVQNGLLELLAEAIE